MQDQADARRYEIRRVLRNHYLAQIECDHKEQRDRPHCACSLVDLGWQLTIGQAVDAWIDHVLALVA